MEINPLDRTIILHFSDFLLVNGVELPTPDPVAVVRIAIPCTNCGVSVAWNLLVLSPDQHPTWQDTSQKNLHEKTTRLWKADTPNSHECLTGQESEPGLWTISPQE